MLRNCNHAICQNWTITLLASLFATVLHTMSTATALRLVVYIAVLASAASFVVVSPTSLNRPGLSASIPQKMQRLSEIDEMCIENMAEYCLKAENALSANGNGGECDVEEYQALVNQLRDQRAILASHVDYVDSLLLKLQAATTGNGNAMPESTVAQETYFAG
jgi:hypothetical protein